MPLLKKERIKDQMLRTAARLWNVPENEIETSFDPLALLMMEACAAELEKIGYDINASHDRLLDKLASLILPETMLGPRPASAVMHGTPTEATSTVDPLLRFYNTQMIKSAGGNATSLDLHYSPVGEFLVHKATLAYTMVGSKLYKMSETSSSRELVAGGGNAADLVDEIWLAIVPDQDLKSLKGLSLFFDLRSHSEAGAFYKSLETMQAQANGKDLKMGKGYYNHEQFEMKLDEMLVSGDDYTKKIARTVAGVYQNRFMHIASDEPVQSLLSAEAPAIWQQKFPQATLKKVTEQPMIYIRLQPGRVFHQDVLETAGISINAFPIVNRRYHTFNYRTDAWVNIIPIRVESSFLDLHSIISATGGSFRFRMTSSSANGAQGLEEGEALIRSTGVGKTDSREVREIINSLMEAIRDESAFFSELNNEFIQGRLREISQILARLEDQVDRAKDNQASYQYILLRPHKAGEQLTINYWTTDGPDAHTVKAGTSITPMNHAVISPKQCFLLTNMLGGKSGVTEAEKKTLLRQQLHSRGKVVSAEDVKLMSLQVFGNRLKHVEVSKGVQIGAGKGDGFSRTIDVSLTLNGDTGGEAMAEIDYLRSELEYALEKNASPVYPFRVMIV
jgi:hypothetical protein